MLLCPRNFPGKNTGVGRHALLSDQDSEQPVHDFHVGLDTGSPERVI